MTFREGLTSSSNRASRGGGGGRGGMIAGGGIGGLLIVLVALFFGIDPGLLGGLTGGGSTYDTQEAPAPSTDGEVICKTAEDANTNTECRLEWTAKSLDQVWTEQLPKQAGIEYEAPGLHLFNQTVSTACGQASSNTGPFFCPADRTAYFDASFFSLPEQLGGSSDPFAQEYIVAHEFGHSIQQLEGTLGLSDYENPGADSNAVKIELQADCYGGIWAHHAAQGEDAFLEPITNEQVASAIQSTKAVGDDNIQKRSGGQVRPDQWTHGSSEQRTQAFLTGYETGSMASCDFLERGVYQQ